MNSDPAHGQQIEDAKRLLARELLALRKHRDALAGRLPRPDQRLQVDALAGSLGADLQRLARLVDSGQASWASVFDQTSPYAVLAREHLEKMIVTHHDLVLDTLRNDATFDPTGEPAD